MLRHMMKPVPQDIAAPWHGSDDQQEAATANFWGAFGAAKLHDDRKRRFQRTVTGAIGALSGFALGMALHHLGLLLAVLFVAVVLMAVLVEASLYYRSHRRHVSWQNKIDEGIVDLGPNWEEMRKQQTPLEVGNKDVA